MFHYSHLACCCGVFNPLHWVTSPTPPCPLRGCLDCSLRHMQNQHLHCKCITLIVLLHSCPRKHLSLTARAGRSSATTLPGFVSPPASSCGRLLYGLPWRCRSINTLAKSCLHSLQEHHISIPCWLFSVQLQFASYWPNSLRPPCVLLSSSTQRQTQILPNDTTLSSALLDLVTYLDLIGAEDQWGSSHFGRQNFSNIWMLLKRWNSCVCSGVLCALRPAERTPVDPEGWRGTDGREGTRVGAARQY